MMRLATVVRRGQWYAARLAAMPPAEIPHRLGEATRRMVWRRKTSGWQAFERVGDGALADLAALRRRLARFTVFEAGSAVRESVRRICDGRLTFLGEDWPSIGSIADDPLRIPPTFWFYDPITGKSWPDAATSSFDVNVRATGTGTGGADMADADMGDVKYVWEPNRLQMLHPLAAVVAGTQDQNAFRVAFGIISSWAAANPPYRGVNWKSGIELALRLVSLTLFVAAAGPATLSLEQRVMVRAIIVAHARYLAAFPSLHSSANNHRIAEGLGLFLAGALLPDLSEARAWLDEGRHIIETEATRQILSDGVGAEQSPTYQAFSMEMIALAAQLANDLGMPLDPQVIERLVRGAEFLSWLSDENGLVPAIGDDDEGRVIAQPPDREPRYVASIVAAVAGFAKRDDLLVRARDPHLRDVIFDSPPQSSGENNGLRVFEQGGVSVANDKLFGRRFHLVFDHGPLGLMPLAAHGHADALAIWLTIDGEPVFIDAGTYRYFSGGQTRSALREGLAHNSLVIDQVTPSRTATAFSWKTSANARLIEATQGPAWSVAGEHDGYRKGFSVRHVRRIRRVETGFVIDDRLLGNARPLPVTLRFLCDPRVSIALNGDNVVISGRRGVLCRIGPPRGFVADIVESAHSQRFGHLAPTSQVVLTGALAADVATTRVAISGEAKTWAHLGDGEVIASRTQTDMREEAWH
jgi:uncharacterized heparinase superfamily protein